MALNIPMPPFPGSGLVDALEKGSSMFSRFMQPVIQREQLAEQGKYHQGSLAHQERALQEQMKQHAQEYALKQMMERRLMQGTAMQNQVRALQMQKLRNQLDPNHEINQIKRLYELANEAQYGNQQFTSNKNNIPANELLRDKLSSIGMFGKGNELPQGEGAFPLTGQNQVSEYPVSESTQNKSNNGNPNLMQMIVGGALKKKTGVNPFAVDKLTGPARDAQSMKILADTEGKNSEVYKMAEAMNNAKKQQQEDLSLIRQRQMHGLKPGDVEIKDPNTNEVIGFRKQTTDKQKEAAKNTVLFNSLYPLVQGSANLSGPGATLRFEEAARTYHTNPESRKIIDDLLIADKAAATTTVTEASRFGAGHTNQTFNRLIDTLKSEDIPKKLKKWIKEYGIPAEANIKAGKRWQEELNKAEKLANSRIPATMDYYFDPDKQFAHQQKMINENLNTKNTDFSKMSDEELRAILGE